MTPEQFESDPYYGATEPECDYCARFFDRFRCNKPDNCDCPKCQGYCYCTKPSPASAQARAAEPE